ncbi:2-oxoglutaroyl-CoA hydrolase [Paraburkholderia sp. GAS199]|uniref:enoyl-CoA hydratase/isomerase family protein n=1 Tax=Paraburkholderia sp. GAS199 TaxID=3035126 RepID=UPI003D253F08
MSQFVYRAPDLPANLDGFRVELSAQDSRADIVLDRPPFNLISVRQQEQIRAVFEALDAAPSVRIIVVRGANEHFSRGSDAEDAVDMSPLDVSRSGWNLSSPRRCSKPVIAANRGYCFGAAFELSLACDFRIATETTLYALPAKKGGQIADLASAACLRRLIGAGRTKDIVMRSRLIRGVQAYDWGMATEFVVDNELESVTDALVRELLAVSPLSQRAAKKLLNDIEDMPQPPEIETDLYSYRNLGDSSARYEADQGCCKTQ